MKRLPAYIAILARLELKRIAAFWQFAARDLVFDACALIAVAILYVCVRNSFHLLLGAAPAVRLGIAGVIGAALFFSAWAGVGSPARERLLAGPFHQLVCEPGHMTRWMLIRAGAICSAGSVLLALALTTLDPLSAGLFLITSLVGGAVAAAVAPLTDGRRPSIGPASAATPRPSRLTPSFPAAIIAFSALRRGPMPAWIVAIALILLGGAAGGLAARNNSGPDAGYLISSIACVLAGSAVFPRGALPGMLGRQPLGLARLYLWLYAGPLIIALVGGVAAGLVGGLGLVAGLRIGVGAATGVLVISWFAFLHGLIRSRQRATTGAALEFSGALLMAYVEASLGPVWLAGRGVILVRAARKRRWLDR